MERSHIGCRRGKDRPGHGPRELDIRLARAVTGSVSMVLECAVMVVMPMLDGLFMNGGLLESGMRSP